MAVSSKYVLSTVGIKHSSLRDWKIPWHWTAVEDFLVHCPSLASWQAWAVFITGSLLATLIFRKLLICPSKYIWEGSFIPRRRGWNRPRFVTPWEGIPSHLFRNVLARWSSSSRWVWWILCTDKWNRRERRIYLLYVATLYSPLTWHLLSRFSSFSWRRPFRKARWSEAVFLWVMEEPRNLWGSSSIVLRFPSNCFAKNLQINLCTSRRGSSWNYCTHWTFRFTLRYHMIIFIGDVWDRSSTKVLN